MLLTALVFTVKVAVVAPSATVMIAGTVAAVSSLVRVTSAPPAGAGFVSVTVPAEEVPPITVEGLSDTDAKLLVGVATKKMSR